MKKILVFSLVGLILFTGCGKKEEKDKFAKYQDSNKEIVNYMQNLETEDGIKEFENIMVIDNNTLETQFGLTVDDVDNYVAQASYELNSKMYIAVKPAEGKRERVEKLLDIYVDNIENRLEMEKENLEDTTEIDAQIQMIKNSVKEEYNGYLIYIASSSNDEVLKELKERLK